MTKDEALKLAMEAMEITGGFDVEINAIKEALAQPEQEPVAWKTDDVELYVREDKFGFYNIPLYTHPPQRKPLTDEEIGNCIDEVNLTSEYGHHHFGWHKQFARAIEAAHGIKE